jgi:hypothetical protein
MSNFLRVGLPMITFCVIGAYGLAKLNQGRYDSRKREQRRADQADTRQVHEEYSLEREHAKMMQEIDLEKWEPKRIVR